MTSKENILKKIEINRLARSVANSLIPRKQVHSVDRESMHKLLALAGWHRINERDLTLYSPEPAADPPTLLVLDAGLALYRTAIADVVMRKSPTVKEMISIRNAIKILKDDDVLISKKAETVRFVQQAGIDGLDLTFSRQDIDKIRVDGAASLESGYPEGILEALDIFAELLDYQPPPKAFKQPHCHVTGRLVEAAKGGMQYGPVVLFNRTHTLLGLIDQPMGAFDKAAMERFKQVADGNEQAPVRGTDVFKWLMEAVFARPSLGQPDRSD